MQRQFEGFHNVLLRLEGQFERGVPWERVLENELGGVLAQLNIEREEQKLPPLERVPTDTWRYWHEQVHDAWRRWKDASTRGSR